MKKINIFVSFEDKNILKTYLIIYNNEEISKAISLIAGACYGRRMYDG